MSFHLWYLGIEQGTQRNLLESVGETHVGMSFWGLRRRLPKTKPYTLEDRFPSTFEIFLDSGGYSANKTPATVEEFEEYAAQYEAFVSANLDRISLVTEFDCLAMGQEWIEEQRQTFWADVPREKFAPVWHGEQTLAELDRLAMEYDNVGIPESALEMHTTLAIRIANLSGKYGTQFHALACAKPYNLHAVRFNTAATTSWLSPMKYGETIVWDGQKMHRYTAAYKEQARKRHKTLFIREGFDFDKILADDPTEVARFTLWSFRQMEAHVDKRRPPVTNPFTVIQGGGELSDNKEGGTTSPFEEIASEPVDNFVVERGSSTGSTLVPRSDTERQILPILGTHTKHGGGDGDGPAGPLLLNARGDTARQCNTCYIKESCPAFQENSSCKFSLPVEIKTREQLEAVLDTLVEVQVKRALFGAFTEEVEGGINPNVSQEMDRAINAVKKRKEILDNSNYLRVQVESRGSAGVLSQIFGEQAKSMRPQEADLTTRADRMLDSGIIDADIVE